MNILNTDLHVPYLVFIKIDNKFALDKLRHKS